MADGRHYREIMMWGYCYHDTWDDAIKCALRRSFREKRRMRVHKVRPRQPRTKRLWYVARLPVRSSHPRGAEGDPGRLSSRSRG